MSHKAFKMYIRSSCRTGGIQFPSFLLTNKFDVLNPSWWPNSMINFLIPLISLLTLSISLLWLATDCWTFLNHLHSLVPAMYAANFSQSWIFEVYLGLWEAIQKCFILVSSHQSHQHVIRSCKLFSVDMDWTQVEPSISHLTLWLSRESPGMQQLSLHAKTRWIKDKNISWARVSRCG